MMRKKAAAALFLSAVPAFLTMALFTGTAQADGARSGDGCGHDSPRTRIASDGDTPWGRATSDDDTPWGRRCASGHGFSFGGDTAWDGDTPWG